MGKNRRNLLIAIIVLILVSLACSAGDVPAGKAPTATSKGPTPQVMKFLESDCNVPGVTFTTTHVGYNTDNIYDGPSLTCHTSSTGAHGLAESAYISILALKPDELEKAYQGKQAVNQGFVATAKEWNADPKLPAELIAEITFLSDTDDYADAYTFMITQYANVQECVLGTGYGVEKINGKYLVELTFTSCELGDAGAYVSMMEKLMGAAMAAIQRIDGASKP
jgi:hypothetical protein